MKNFYVYILANGRNGTLYIGITNDLARRVYEHREKLREGFTKEYEVNSLVYFETFSDPAEAIKREKRLKAWKRAWKIELIEKENPEWIDLSTVGYSTVGLDTRPDLRKQSRVIPAKAGIQALSQPDTSEDLDPCVRRDDNTARSQE